MGYRLENKEIDLSRLRKVTFLPSQKAGDVYRYKNYVLRIFKDGEKIIDEKTARYLTDISTDRIILPKKLLFYNNAFKGYAMKLVSQRGAGKRIITTPKDDFISCVEYLERDVETLSQKKVLLNDINPGYALYNGELYLVNPVNYSTLASGDYFTLEQLNRFQLHLLLTELIVNDLKKSKYNSATINYFRELLNLRDNDERSSSYLREVMRGQDNLKELVKKLI
ncbi:MAG: hypothetical protein IJI22_01720 [Bacilli bacterium]|nr:hypothetical protein [Bacilli bacterium]